jgi:hypothetical protein
LKHFDNIRLAALSSSKDFNQCPRIYESQHNNPVSMEKESDISFIAEYMEKGFLENIIDMFRHDKDLYALIGDLMRDERIRVRIGMTALVEDLSKSDPQHIRHAVPGIAALLKDMNPATRGDAAYLLGIIGHCDALPFLNEALEDEDQQVREIIWESVEEIRKADESLERGKQLRKI